MAPGTADEMALKVQKSLENGPYACSKLEALSGGTGNFVYRGTLKENLGEGTETVVVKHTEGYVASNPGFKLSDTRCEYEKEILTALHSFPPLLDSGIEIQTPHIYFFGTETNTQVYSDLPSALDLKTYVLTHSETLTEAQCQRLGHALGVWCRKFHVWGNSEEQKGLRDAIKGNGKMRELKFMINYQMLLSRIDEFPKILEKNREVFEKVVKSVRDELDAKDGTLIHGDFWTGNILLPSGPISDSSDHPLKIFVIDWELSQLSSPAYDLGQMIAEMFELKHFKNIDAGEWLVDAFLQGYSQFEAAYGDMKWNVLIHVGVHLVCWGSRVDGWGTEEQVEKVVELGSKCIVRGWEKKEIDYKGLSSRELFEGQK